MTPEILEISFKGNKKVHYFNPKEIKVKPGDYVIVEADKGIDELVASGIREDVVRDIIARIGRSEYKRWQAPPGLRISPRAFDYGRRYPIACRWDARGFQNSKKSTA